MEITSTTPKGKTLEWTLAAFLGIFVPLLSIFLVLYACPAMDDDTFGLPLLSTRCAGEIIGEIGLLVFSLPFMITIAITILFEYILLQNAMYTTTGGILVVFACLPGLLVNTLLYWLIIKAIFLSVEKIKMQKNPPDLPN